MKRENKLIFIHIPKTAGSNTTKILTQFYKNRFPGAHFQTFVHKKKILDRYNLYAGHVGYGIRNLLPNIPIVTFVRDPIDQFQSYIKFAQRQGNTHYLWNKTKYNSLEEALEIQDVIDIIGNIQTLYLGVDFPYDNTQKMEQYKNKDWEKLLDNAKQRIKNEILYIGIKEEYSRSIKELIYYIGFDDIRRRLGLTIRERHTLYTPSEDIKKKICQINEVDIELYNFVKEWNNGKNSMFASG